MRGKPMPSRRGVRVRGITPADAGKTPRIALIGQLKKDHPRGCGENSEVKRMNVFNLGSPPRMRGKLLDILAARASSRITPADAGKTA